MRAHINATCTITGSWSEIKPLIDAKNLTYQSLEQTEPTRVEIIAIDGPVVYTTEILEGGEGWDEWVSVYAPHTNLANSSVRADGVVRVQIEPSDVKQRTREQGFRFLAAAESVTSHRVTWDATVSMQGLDLLEAVSHTEGDHIELFAYLKTGTARAIFEAVTGVAWPFGELISTPAEVDLFQFGVDCFVPKSGTFPSLVAEGPFVIPTFIGLRFDYHAVGAATWVHGLIRTWVSV